MKDTVFLAVDRSGVVRMTKRWPSLSRDEIGVKITVNVPDTAFRSPVIAASLDVPEDRTIQPDIDITVDEIPADDPS
jgi:hypothetical protein